MGLLHGTVPLENSLAGFFFFFNFYHFDMWQNQYNIVKLKKFFIEV